jgi:hypothetical protein
VGRRAGRRGGCAILRAIARFQALNLIFLQLEKKCAALIALPVVLFYPRSAQVVMAGLDPAIHENTVISNLSC